MKRTCWGCRLSVATILVYGSAIALPAAGIVITVNPSFAQITPDATLGTEASVVTPNAQIRGLPAELIQGGAFRGSALFHSFAEFNIENGQRVYFANPTGIANIFSRITGNDTSDILGTLGVNGAANLYLLNPNGIIFGPNAQLDVAGSFVATTANCFVFNNGGEFSATNPQAPPILAINVTPGLQYGAIASGVTIANSGNLTVGKDLTLLADNLNLQGELNAGGNLKLQGDTVRIRDSAANPFIAAASGNLLIEGTSNIDIFALNHPNSGLFSGGDTILRSENTVSGDAHFTAGGSFRIEELDGNLGNLFSPEDPVIRAAGDVIFGGYQGASLHIFAGGSVTIPGGVIIGAGDPLFGIVENVTLSDGTQTAINGKTTPTLDIRAGTNAVGNPGIIGIPPLGNIIPAPPIQTPIPTSANITIGGILNLGGMVFLTNQYQPNSLLPGGTITVNQLTTVPGVNTAIATANQNGNGGKIIMDSRGAILLNGTVNSSSFSPLSPLPPGNGGNITLIANGDIKTSEMTSIGLLGGNINLTSNSKISLANYAIVSGSASPFPIGKGGDINIKASSVSVTDGARIIAATIGAADGGNIKVNADLLEVSRAASGGILSPELSVIIARIASFPGGLYAINTGIGDGGNINLETGQLKAEDIGQISAYTFGLGNGGDLTVKAKSIELLGGSSDSNPGGLFAQTFEAGNAGDVTVDTENLTIRNGGIVSASSIKGSGNGGTLILNASDFIEIIGTNSNGTFPSAVGNLARGSGNAGPITINTRRLILRDGGAIGTATFAQGNGGDLTINASESVELSGKAAIGPISSALSVETYYLPPDAGDAGRLIVNTKRLSLANGAYISASTFGSGLGGNIEINATESIELKSTPNDFVPSGLYAQGFGTGNAGNLKVNTGELTLRDGARITVATGTVAKDLRFDSSSFLLGGDLNVEFSDIATGNAGSMEISANSIILDNQSSLIAKTISGEGGNISLNARDLILLRRESLISAEAFGGKGDGGNIIIDPPFVIGSENSDIVADAFGGNGGNINITANSIIGLQFRPFRTTLNDITASSQFGLQGNVVINTPEVDPSSGLVELPNELVDVQGLVDPTCKADIAENQSQFVVTGRGGLPAKPNETLRGEGVLADWVSLDSEIGDREANINPIQVQTSTPKRIVEAQGWVVNRDGTVILTADASHLTSDNPLSNPTTCH